MKKNLKLYLFLLIISFFCILICSKNSPLYCFNDWNDENAFMTVSKSWLNGLIPYRDIFEQKGPFLYFIFLLANIFSKTSFIGVFILETISMFFTLFFLYKLIKLYLKEMHIYAILPIFTSLIVSSVFFVQGGSAEEFSLPFFSYSLYIFFKFIKTEQINNKELFFSGLCSGLVFMIKFNLVGFWIGFVLTIIIYNLKNKKIKKSLINTLFFIIGMFIPIITFSIYFLINNSFYDFINIYFFFNANNYTNNNSLIIRIEKIVFYFFNDLRKNIAILECFIIWFVSTLKTNIFTNNKFLKKMIYITFILSFIGIYFGHFPYSYYFLPITIFSILGLINIFYFIEKKYNPKKYNILISLSLIISLLLLFNSENISFMKYRKNDLVQFKYAKIINEIKKAKILNYCFLDGGFYIASNTLPNTKYFEKQNAYIPEYESTINKMIKGKEFDYIIAQKKCLSSEKSIYEYYVQIECNNQLNEKENTYCILKKKD